jgi:hypothetical protein
MSNDNVVVPFPHTQEGEGAPAAPATALATALAMLITLTGAALELIQFALLVAALMLAGVGLAVLIALLGRA